MIKINQNMETCTASSKSYLNKEEKPDFLIALISGGPTIAVTIVAIAAFMEVSTAARLQIERKASTSSL